MNKKTVAGALLSPLPGWIAALLFLMISAAACASADEPDRMSGFLGIAAIAAGALVCGLVSRIVKSKAAGFVSGALYVLPLICASFILGGKDALPAGIRLVIFAAAAMIAGVISALPSGRMKRNGIAGSRNAVNRYFERNAR